MENMGQGWNTQIKVVSWRQALFRYTLTCSLNWMFEMPFRIDSGITCCCFCCDPESVSVSWRGLGMVPVLPLLPLLTLPAVVIVTLTGACVVVAAATETRGVSTVGLDVDPSSGENWPADRGDDIENATLSVNTWPPSRNTTKVHIEIV